MSILNHLSPMYKSQYLAKISESTWGLSFTQPFPKDTRRSRLRLSHFSSFFAAVVVIWQANKSDSVRMSVRESAALLPTSLVRPPKRSRGLKCIDAVFPGYEVSMEISLELSKRERQRQTTTKSAF